MSEQKKLRQGENDVKLVGLVYDLSRLEIKPFESKKFAGKKYNAITGDLAIKVNDAIFYATVFQAEHYFDDQGNRTENKGYKAWNTVLEEYKSVQKDGEENADKVVLSAGRRTKNEYGSPDGELVSNDRLQFNFVRRITNSDNFVPEATFIQELFITSQRPEQVKGEDGELEETGNIILTGYTPDYNGDIQPFEVYVEGDDKVSYVQENYVNGATVKVHGDIIQKKEVTVKEVKAAFGSPKTQTFTKTKTLYSVEGGNDPEEYADADDTETAETNRKFDTELIKQAIQKREKMLADMIQKAKNGGNSNSKPKQDKKAGFGTKAPVTTQAAGGLDISEDDLPF